MALEEFHFTGASGTMLAGLIEQPEGVARGWAIFAHCFTCTKSSLAAVRIVNLEDAGLGKGRARPLGARKAWVAVHLDGPTIKACGR